MIPRGAALAPLLILALAPFPAPCLAANESADEPPIADFLALSLEQLASIKVTSVAKKQQRLSQVAAAVYVITQEEIHRSGMTSVPEVLRMAPGLSVARIDGSKWAVASRGFNGRFANKLMVLIDGRSVYSPIFSGVYWDMSMPLLDDIERIEVTRGAGATMWGANAVNGVVDIITKSARSVRGTQITTGTGSAEQGFGEIRNGGRFGGLDYRAWVSARGVDELETTEGAPARDGWYSMQGGFRLDRSGKHDSWTLEGDLFRNHRSENGLMPSLSSPRPSVYFTEATGASGTLAAEWRRQYHEGAELRLSAYYDDTNRPEASVPVAHTRTGDLQAQYRFGVGGHHDIVIGADDRVIALNIQGNEAYSFSRSSLTYNTASMFAQDEIHLLHDQLLLTAGLKMEHDYFIGWLAQPTARILWARDKDHSAWFSVGRAVRTPTPYERDVSASLTAIPASPETGGLPGLATVVGSPNLGAETLTAFELGYRTQISPKLSLDLAVFHNDYGALRTLSRETPEVKFQPQPYLNIPLVFHNYGSADAAGAEVSAVWHPVRAWKLSGSYTWLTMKLRVASDAPPGTVDGSVQGAPSQQWKLQSYINISRTIHADTFLYYSGIAQPDSVLNPGAVIPAYLRLDARLGWHPRRNWELSLVGQNLLQTRHLEFIPEALSAPSLVAREFYVKSSWKF